MAKKAKQIFGWMKGLTNKKSKKKVSGVIKRRNSLAKTEKRKMNIAAGPMLAAIAAMKRRQRLGIGNNRQPVRRKRQSVKGKRGSLKSRRSSRA